MSAVLSEPAPLSERALDKLCAELLDHRFVASSQLMGTFSASRGFGLAFRDDGLDEARGRFPFITPFLRASLDDERRRKLSGLLRKARPPNAFYLNLLLLEEGDQVGAHVDATLGASRALSDLNVDNDEPPRTPELVSVLYLSAPAQGGELVVTDPHPPWRERANLQPLRGAMVWFRGHLRHEVRPFVGEGVRASLVLEQYAIDDDERDLVPRFRVQSKAGFAGYLKGS